MENKIHLPGFNAETAVYKSSTTVFLTTSVGTPRNLVITPQQLPLNIGGLVRVSDKFIALRRLLEAGFQSTSAAPNFEDVRRRLECGFQYWACEEGCSYANYYNNCAHLSGEAYDNCVNTAVAICKSSCLIARDQCLVNIL